MSLLFITVLYYYNIVPLLFNCFDSVSKSVKVCTVGFADEQYGLGSDWVKGMG